MAFLNTFVALKCALEPLRYIAGLQKHFLAFQILVMLVDDVKHVEKGNSVERRNDVWLQKTRYYIPLEKSMRIDIICI